MGNPLTYFEVKRSKIRIAGSESVKAAASTRYVHIYTCMWREDVGIDTLNSQCGCSFTLPPIDSMHYSFTRSVAAVYVCRLCSSTQRSHQ